MAGGLFGLGKPQPSRFPYPGRPQPSPGIAPSPGVVVRANTVIVFGPSGTPVGVFVYQPGTTPALGNSPVLWMTENLADPFGNVLPVNGIVSFFAGSGAYAKLLAGQLSLFNGTDFRPSSLDGTSAGTLTIGSATETSLDANAILRMLSKAANAGVEPLVVLLNSTSLEVDGRITATRGTAALPTLITTDSWQAISSFQNGWTATAGGLARFRLLPNGLVYIQADVTAGTITNTTNMFQLPSVAIYNPVQVTPLPAFVAAGATAAPTSSPFVNITTSRVVQCQNLPTGTTRVIISAFYPSGSQLP